MNASKSSQPPTVPFIFPKSYAFPPFFTLQPNLTSRHAQLLKWSRLIQTYCRHHRLYRLSVPACLELDLFRNAELRKRLSERDVRQVINWMASDEGAKRVEWIDRKGGGSGDSEGGEFWVFWKRPEEWGETVYNWVDGTGQKGVVLTFYEILNGEGTRGQDFHGMDTELFQRAMTVLVKKGKSQVFGSEDQQGVKFF